MKRILWFRRDLRVEDNPLLSLGGEVLPIFIFDTNILNLLEKDDRRVNFIFYYVQKLKAELQENGLDLKIFYGEPLKVFDYILKDGFDEVVATGDYDEYARTRDLKISHKVHFRYLQDTYIFRHDEVLKSDGSPYYVFTPFYNKARVILNDKKLEKSVFVKQNLFQDDYEGILNINEKLETTKLPLAIKSIGFDEVDLDIVPAKKKLQDFKENIVVYKEKRDFLASEVTSKLSVDLRFGTIGIREVLRFMFENEPLHVEPFIRQLIFRDFYAYLLFHIPQLEHENYKYAFNGIKDSKKYELFCKAKTGFPIVDAGVRELLQTGDMHNRVRMVVASFFVKDLLLPWQWGEAFFAKHLLDYDKASNVLSWQWSAGTGVDPQPYFRVFNPYLQSKRFDKDGVYIRRYVSELESLEAKYLHDENYLLEHDIKGYPKPIVKHKEAAKKAIEIFRA